MAEAPRDQNHVPAALFESSTTPGQTYPGQIVVATGRIKVDNAGGGSGTVTSVDVSGGTTGLTFSGGPITTSGTITMAGTLGAANGGTGQTSYTKGDILVASASTTLTKLAVGSNNQVLTADSGQATGVKWATPSTGGQVNSVVGTTNRITVDSTDPTAPIVDIAATYAGQTSIVTLGTVTTGTWNATAIAVNKIAAITASRAVVSDASGFISAATTTSTQIGYLSAATGTTGTTSTNIVFSTSPTLVTPTLGVASATSINKVAITAPATSATLTIADGKTLTASVTMTLQGGDSSVLSISASKTVTHSATTTFAGTDGKTLTISNSGTLGGGDAFVLAIAASKTFTVSNTLTLAGTDSTTMTFPTTTATIARTDAGQTFTGVQTITNITLPTNGQILLTVPTTDGHATGPTCNTFNSGYSSSAVGDLVYLDSSSTWQKCDANTTLLYNGMLGIALAVASSGNPLLVALPGSFVYATAFPTFTIGGPIFMSETAGAVTQTAPTTTDSATRMIGWGIHADKMYFFPSPDYITHT